MRAAGVNRISLGVQSLREPDLAALARGHTTDEARSAYAEVRDAGFENVSIDLIYGIPGQSLADWQAGLEGAVGLQPDHLSLYGLQLALAPDEWAAPPRSGALRWRRRLAARQDDDLAADQYRHAEDRLAAAGYVHYELSSWARPGYESRHNSAYWARRPYTGIGAGAHSYDGTSRSWNSRDLDRYLAEVGAGKRPFAGGETLDEPTRAFEAVALGLRRVRGLDRAAFSAEFGLDPTARYARAVADGRDRGLLELDDSHLRLSARGRLLANEALIAFAP
jgi:oxygen-independent coproporphyrinogen-3 oxidase